MYSGKFPWMHIFLNDLLMGDTISLMCLYEIEKSYLSAGCIRFLAYSCAFARIMGFILCLI